MCQTPAEISVSEQLISFIEETKDYKLNNKEKKELMRAFVSYLIDESNGNKYQEEISSFIIKNQMIKNNRVFKFS